MNSAVNTKRTQTPGKTAAPAPNTTAAAWARHAGAANGFGDLPTNDEAFRAAPSSYDRYQAARAHRAVVLGELMAAAMQWLDALVRRAYLRNRERREARAAYEALRRLDDRTLRDLGFHRSETMSIAAELASEEEPTRTRLGRVADSQASGAHDAAEGTGDVPPHPRRSPMPAERYASSTPRAAAALAAAVLTTITIGAFVAVPASVEADGGKESLLAGSRPVDMALGAPTLAAGATLLTTLRRRTLARHAGNLAKRLGRWLERRRVASIALRELAAMDERELHDIGVDRADLNRIAWGASSRDWERRNPEGGGPEPHGTRRRGSARAGHEDGSLALSRR